MDNEKSLSDENMKYNYGETWVMKCGMNSVMKWEQNSKDPLDGQKEE